MTHAFDHSDTRFIVRTDEHFKGFSQSIVLPDGKIAWTEFESFEEYKAARGDHFKIVTAEELDVMTKEYLASQVTEPKAISREDYNYALEVLPPSKFGSSSGMEVFHVSERITGNLVNWYAKMGTKCYHMVDRDDQLPEVTKAFIQAHRGSK